MKLNKLRFIFLKTLDLSLIEIVIVTFSEGLTFEPLMRGFAMSASSSCWNCANCLNGASRLNGCPSGFLPCNYYRLGTTINFTIFYHVT